MGTFYLCAAAHSSLLRTACPTRLIDTYCRSVVFIPLKVISKSKVDLGQLSRALPGSGQSHQKPEGAAPKSCPHCVANSLMATKG